MIKINIEIKDEKFIYSYTIGKSEHNGEAPICPESLHKFNIITQMLHTYYTQDYKEWEHEIAAKAYLDKHPELLKGA